MITSVSERPPLLQVCGVGVQFGKRTLIESASFELERGQITALLGPNGAGKTLLLKATAGLLPRGSVRAGLVRFNGIDVFKLDPETRASKIAYLSSDTASDFPLTVYEVVELGRLRFRGGWLGKLSSRDRDKIENAIDVCGCSEFRNRDWTTLSGGERQLVHLARALAQEAQVLLLDEAFSKLDLNHQARIGKLIQQLSQQGLTFVWVSHDLNFLFQWATRFMLMKSGNVFRAPSAAPVSTEEFSKLYPGAGIRVGSSPLSHSPIISWEK